MILFFNIFHYASKLLGAKEVAAAGGVHHALAGPSGLGGEHGQGLGEWGLFGEVLCPEKVLLEVRPEILWSSEVKQRGGLSDDDGITGGSDDMVRQTPAGLEAVWALQVLHCVVEDDGDGRVVRGFAGVHVQADGHGVALANWCCAQNLGVERLSSFERDGLFGVRVVWLHCEVDEVLHGVGRRRRGGGVQRLAHASTVVCKSQTGYPGGKSQTGYLGHRQDE